MSVSSTAPTLTGVLTTWRLPAVGIAVLLVGAVVYPWLAFRLRRHGQRWPVGRIMCWYLGLICLAIGLGSALAVYSHNLFSVHMIVHLLMIMVAPAFFVWAQPVRLVHDTGGPQIARLVDRLRLRSPLRFLVSLWFTVPLYVAVIVLTHLTGFQQAMATHMWIHDTELLLYFVSGYLLLLPLIGDELTTDTPRPYSLRLVVLALCTGPDTLVGVTLTLAADSLHRR
ncbi:cytochrome c oxidase assembly protein [Nocardia sp. NPDC051570]|uniref:cytochrome c oxidase assembly protein n=1 Tax=Nocardia sp. NPDC051570 TaxID=3364324 RepID=UPI0037B7B3C0